MACRYPGSPFVCLPGLRLPLPSRSGRGCPQGALSRGAAPPFVPSDSGRRSGGGGARSARSPSPGHARRQRDATPSGPGCRPPQCAPDLRAPRPSAGGGRGQGHLSTCGGPRRLPGVPWRQVARTWVVGVGCLPGNPGAGVKVRVRVFVCLLSWKTEPRPGSQG